MSMPAPLNPNIPKARKPARIFTPQTPFHHPNLDPNLPIDDIPLVPQALFSKTKLNRELPRPAVTNLHIMLKLRNDPDKLLNDFHDKIPEIDDVLRLFSEIKGASPTTTGATSAGEGTVFNLASNLETPGRADVIYLTDAVEDNKKCAHSGIPSNLRTVDWLGFDGSYVHLEDAEPKIAAFPTEQALDLNRPKVRRDSTPFNLRVTEWLNDADLPGEAYSVVPGSDAGNASKETGFYETFWADYEPFGHVLT